MEAERRRQVHDWMVRFADGDRGAFQSLFDALWPVMVDFTSMTLPNRADAEDAAQQALLKVFSRIVDFDRQRDGLSWALGIAAFEVMTLRKQHARRRQDAGVDPASLVGEGLDLEAQTVARELGQVLLTAMGELSDRDRLALAPVLAGEDVAGDESSRKRRYRAVERLRAAWRRIHG